MAKIIMKVEDKYNLEFPEELYSETLPTYKTIISCIKENVKEY
jgi:acyl carrier protein